MENRKYQGQVKKTETFASGHIRHGETVVTKGEMKNGCWHQYNVTTTNANGNTYPGGVKLD